MSRFEKFAAEGDVIGRIEELRAEGHADDEITVISKQKLENAYLKYRDVNFKNSEGTTWDKFISMFSDDDPKDKVLGQFDITDSEKEHFKDALDREEILLLKENYGVSGEGYVQNETREHHETQQQDAQTMESEAARDERLDAQKEMPRQQTRDDHSYGYRNEPERNDIEQDHDITLKDTEKDKEYDAPGRKRMEADAYDSLDKDEYGYKK